MSVNFLSSTFTLAFGGATASASYTNPGLVGGFGLFFYGAGDQLFLSTAGAGQPFSNFDVSDLAGRRLLSIDLLDGGERAGLEGWGNRAVLTQSATGVSIPVLFAAQAARTPYQSEHVPGVFDGDVIIFSATRTGNGSPLRDSWRLYVAGDVTEYSVDCTHDEMSNLDVLRSFGAQLNVALGEKVSRVR